MSEESAKSGFNDKTAIPSRLNVITDGSSRRHETKCNPAKSRLVFVAERIACCAS